MLDYLIIIFISYFSIFVLIITVIGAGAMNTKKFVCKNCKKSFDRATHLTKHQEKCREEGENLIATQNFICEKCDRIFDRKDRLTKHKTKHNAKH